MEYMDCKKIAIQNNIGSASEWHNYCKGNKKLPYHPERVYKNRGWVDWLSFLDKKNLNKYKVNDNFFKEIDKNSAYILGLWAADGHIRKNQFSITQNRKDEYLLRNILKVMDSDCPLNSHGSNNVYFQITSQVIVEDIKNIFGVIEDKTFNLKFPKISNEYLPDFIRGFFDGDGCITYQKNQKCYVSSFVSASYEFLHDLHKRLVHNIDSFKGGLNTNKGFNILSIGVNDTRRLGDYMYNTDSILFLRRKKEKFELSGDIRIASFNKDFISYNESRLEIKKLGIKTYKGWKKYKKDNKVENIPSNMEYYKEYKGWKDFIS